MKRLRGQKLQELEAPITSGNNDIELIRKNLENFRNNYDKDKFSDDNPFLIDKKGNPFEPSHPTFFDNNNDIKARPCMVQKKRDSYGYIIDYYYYYYYYYWFFIKI